MTTKLVQNKHCLALASKLTGFQSDDKFCDIDVIVGEETFRCHRVILSAGSEYFEKMFTGPFTESSKTEVTLSEIEPYVFEEVLNFIYNGDAEIRISNVYYLIRAADFYNLPLIVELCTKFIKENLNALAEDILRIFSLAHRLKLTQLVELLRRHIHQNFGYFIWRPEFSELTVDSLMEVLNLITSTRRVSHDVFLEGIYQWVTRQEELTSANRELYLGMLTKKIDLTKLSTLYTTFRMTKFIKEMVPSQSNDGNSGVCNAFLRFANFPTVYVSRNSSDYGHSTGVSIFTARLDGSINTSKQFIWTYSGELGRSIHFMRNVFIGDCLYSLRYLRNNGPQQEFCSGSSISMYPLMTLTAPPCILDEFDLCGARNDIFVYNKNIPPVSNGTEYSGFSQEEISRGIYVYKRDVDEWFPVPCPKTRFTNACMTLDDEGIVYLIGGRNSNRAVQVYDPRTQGWSALSSTIGIYEGAACCAYRNKIYVAGGHNNVVTEMYESGNWKRLKDLPTQNFPQFQLVSWMNNNCGNPQLILNFDRTLLASSRFRYLSPVLNDNWANMSNSMNLFDAVKDMNLTSARLSILDMITL